MVDLGRAPTNTLVASTRQEGSSRSSNGRCSPKYYYEVYELDPGVFDRIGNVGDACLSLSPLPERLATLGLALTRSHVR